MARQDLIEPLPGLLGFQPDLQHPSIEELTGGGIGGLIEQIIIEICRIVAQGVPSDVGWSACRATGYNLTSQSRVKDNIRL